MDIPDDPSTTTATTDFESGSEGVDYVYEGQKVVERKPTKEKSPKRRRSPKAKPRSHARCTCGAARAEDDFEITVFEATESEEERHRSRPRKSRLSGPGDAFGCDDRGHRKIDKRKTADHRTRRVQTAYVEEYPESTPRPAILLREHKLLRRSSTSDTKRLRDSEDRSLSSSRGRSPTGKRLPPRPARLTSKESPKHQKHHRRLDVQETHSGTWAFDSSLVWVDACDTPNTHSQRNFRILALRETPTPTLASRDLSHAVHTTNMTESWLHRLLGARQGMPIRSRRPTLRRGPCRLDLSSSNGGPNPKATSTTARMKATSNPSPSATTTGRATVKGRAVFPLCVSKSTNFHDTKRPDLPSATASAYRPLGLAKGPLLAIPTRRQWNTDTALSPHRYVRFGRARPKIGNPPTPRPATVTMARKPNSPSGSFGWRTFLPAGHHLVSFRHAEKEVTLASRQQTIPLLLTFMDLPRTIWRTPRPVSSLPSMTTAKLGLPKHGMGSFFLTGRRFF